MIEVQFYHGYLTVKMLVTLHEPTDMSFWELIGCILDLCQATIVDAWSSAITFTLPENKFIYSFNVNDYETLIKDSYIETEAMTESRYIEFMTRVKEFGICNTGYLI